MSTGRTYEPSTGEALTELGLDPEEVVTVTRGYLAQVHLDAYTAGLRRAQDLAQPFLYGSELDDFNQAIDAEAAKERT